LHPAARHPASKIAVACIQPLAVRRLFNGLDALQFAAGWAVNCNAMEIVNEENGNNCPNLAIQVNGLRKSYGSHIVLKELDFQIEKAFFVGDRPEL